jgi:hypothetical protein
MNKEQTNKRTRWRLVDWGMDDHDIAAVLGVTPPAVYMQRRKFEGRMLAHRDAPLELNRHNPHARHQLALAVIILMRELHDIMLYTEIEECCEEMVRTGKLLKLLEDCPARLLADKKVKPRKALNLREGAPAWSAFTTAMSQILHPVALSH